MSPRPTVSMCAFKSSERPPPRPRAVATTFGRPGATSQCSTSRPARSSHSATKRAIAASPAPPGTRSGLTESIATSCEVSSASAGSGTEDARGEKGGVFRVVYPDAGDRDAGRHLDDREQGVEAVENAL